MKNKIKKRRTSCAIKAVLFGIIFMMAASIYVVCRWFNQTYGVGLNELLYTMVSPLKGTGVSVIVDILKACLPAILLALAAYCVIAFICCQQSIVVELCISVCQKVRKLNFLKLCRQMGACLCVLLLMGSLFFVEKSLDISGYVRALTQQTTLYEDYYVDPLSVEIQLRGSKKNLIYIYLESMETTYASADVGGKQEINYIPNLTKLAGDNVSFSDKDGLGGFRSSNGDGWTMGALFASTSGLPFAFPTDGNTMDKREVFAGGVTTLGDILESEGYHQEFLCGSDGDFAGRKSYFQQHGNYDVFDYYTAKELGYIEDDYYVWWGYEDSYLYEIAKDELRQLAKAEEPFNLTMLTVDTHHLGGYTCSKCGNEYSEPLENVIACADSQVMDFITWCSKQDFYKDTVIVISGDHPRMDTILVEGVDYNDRTIYNCFINAASSSQGPVQGRIFTSMDMFPTILTAMGYTIEGDRLGLGTNLFSPRQTLAEEIGLEELNGEIAKHSNYYVKTFS